MAFMAIDFKNLVESAGLPELSRMEKQEVASDFMPAAVTGLADGDLYAQHEPYDGHRAELYGRNSFNEGRVSKALGKAAIDNGMSRTDLYDFQGFAAEYYHNPDGPFASHDPLSAIRIFPSAVSVDDNAIGLQRPPTLVVDFAACLTGRSIIRDQLKFLDYQVRPFTYSPLTRTHFMNKVLMMDYDRQLGEGASRLMVDRKMYIGREDDVASATDEILDAQRRHDAPTEVADIVLSTHAQHTSASELQAGIRNAYSLLKDSGLLVIRALAQPDGDETSAEMMAGWAFDAGFDEAKASRHDAIVENTGSLLVSGHFGKQMMQSIVIRK
jgi:hypothetical protein